MNQKRKRERERERERKRMAPGVSLSLSLFVYIKVTFKTIASFSLVRETVSYECNLQSSFFFPLFFDIDNKVCLMSQCMFSGPYETWMYPFNVFWVNGQIGRSLIFISLSLFHLSHHDSPHDIRPTKKKIIYKFSSYISCKSNWLPFARVNIGNTIKLSLSLSLSHMQYEPKLQRHFFWLYSFCIISNFKLTSPSSHMVSNGESHHHHQHRFVVQFWCNMKS